MRRIALSLAILGLLAACAQYQEPQANCFNFLSRLPTADPDCTFTPLGTAEDNVAL